jgi:hypothetical protein
MLQIGYTIFILLHGLVHIWYVTLAQRWVPFEPEMGWTGNSWLLANAMGDTLTRTFATILYSIATLSFVIAGAGVLAQADWWATVLVGAAIVSSLTIFLFWDGSFDMLVQKGMLGFLINIVLLISLLVFNWPAKQL